MDPFQVERLIRANPELREQHQRQKTTEAPTKPSKRIGRKDFGSLEKRRLNDL
jgi:hypothetical protein